MTEISILGCGWLGLPLAKSLIQKGYSVKGSTTSENKVDVLQANNIDPFVISLSEDKIDGDVSGFLSNSKILIIDIPPKISSGNFIDKIRTLIPFIELSGVKKVLFASSISVYGKCDGLVSEETIPVPDTENGRQILEAETLLKNVGFQTTILRFGGLVGENRHPVKHLAGKSDLPSPGAPINLIHLEDCIGIIETIISKHIWNQTLNAVAPFHPSRKEFYTQKAIEFSLPVPLFVNEKTTGRKIVSSDKLIKLLNYEFLGLL